MSGHSSSGRYHDILDLVDEKYIVLMDGLDHLLNYLNLNLNNDLKSLAHLGTAPRNLWVGRLT